MTTYTRRHLNLGVVAALTRNSHVLFIHSYCSTRAAPSLNPNGLEYISAISGRISVLKVVVPFVSIYP